MSNIFRAELSKLTRPRVLIAAAIAVLVASAIATAVVFISADQGGPDAQRGVTLAELAEAGGGSEAFSIGMSFMGFFAFVVLTANWAGEFSQGTFRTLLIKEPRRIALLAGKLAAIIVFAAGLVLAGEVTTWLMSLVAAPTQDISTSAWFSGDALVEAAGDYANAIAGVSAWATFAMMLAVLLRSIPLALGVGIAWAGPFEHITQEAWNAASGVYPGLLLEALAVGGTPDVSYERALLLLAGYVAAAVGVAALTFSRRDVAG